MRHELCPYTSWAFFCTHSPTPKKHELLWIRQSHTETECKGGQRKRRMKEGMNIKNDIWWTETDWYDRLCSAWRLGLWSPSVKESFAGSFRANRSDGMNPGIRIERKNKPGIKSVHKVRYVKPIAPAGVKKHLQRLHIKKESRRTLFLFSRNVFQSSFEVFPEFFDRSDVYPFVRRVGRT